MGLGKLSRWQWTTLITLTFGYAGYYFCRSNLSVAAPLLLEAFGDQGLDKKAIGAIASTAVLFYATGKVFNGVLADFVGGRRMFLLGMALSVVATVIFGLGGGFAVFMGAFCFNRLVQSMGWGALVKTASRWYDARILGTVMGVLCLSFLFGDVLAKLFLGKLIDLGVGWRGVFFASAGVLTGLFIVGNIFLKGSPQDVGEAEPPAAKDNLFGEAGNAPAPANLRDLLGPLVKSPSFWLIALMNIGLTMIREAFNFWTPTYLVEAVSMTEGGAGMASSLFPLFGGVSVVLAGFLSDTVAKGKRGMIMFAFLLPSALALFALARLTDPAGPAGPLLLISAVAFLTLGPYAFLTGVVSVDLGGKKGSSTTAGILDCIGYFAGALSVSVMGNIAQDYGWNAAFSILAVALAVTTVVALAYWFIHELHPARRTPDGPRTDKALEAEA